MNALFELLIRGSIRHRHMVVFGAALLVAAGLWSAKSATFDALPSFAPPMVSVQAEAPGLGSSAVEAQVTTPLERGLLGIADVTRERSVSSPGLARVTLTFEDNIDIFLARQLVAERLAALSSVLPTARMEPISAPVGALLKLAYTPAPGAGLEDLSRYLLWTVRPQLAGTPGVSRVTVHGALEARVEVRPDPVRMLSRGVTIGELKAALQSAQSAVPLGHTNPGSLRTALRGDGLWMYGDPSSIEAIARTAITRHAGIPVLVSDVAEVANGHAAPVGAALFDGQPAVYLQIDKLPWADTLDTTNNVTALLAELDARAPPGSVRHAPVFRQADFIHTSLFAVGRAMGIGIFFVALVLFAFLRSPRLAFISLAALPLSVLAAVVVLVATGVTINGMILGGLAIAVGEVVDDAIVDAENIWRRLRENAKKAAPRPALAVIHDASQEVRGSVVFASLVVIAVLTPLFVLGGLTGRIFSPLAASYALAMAASLAVALTVTPALCALLLPKLLERDPGEARLARAARGLYTRVLGVVARRPGSVALTSLALGIAATVGLFWIGGGFLPEFREGVLIAEVTAAPGTSLAETTRLAGRLDAVLRTDAGLPHVAVRIGRASLDEDAAPVYRMEADLVLSGAGDEPEVVAHRIMAHMADVPGLRFGVDGFLGERINELLAGERAPIVVELTGDDLGELRTTAEKLVQAIAPLKGVESVLSKSLADTPTLDVELDDAQLALLNLRRSDVLEALAAARAGLEVASLRTASGFHVPLVIAGQASAQTTARLPDLPLLLFPSESLPLSVVATLQTSSEPPFIQHARGRRLINLSVTAETREVPAVAQRIEALLQKSPPPPGVHAAVTGQAAERRAATRQLVVTTLLVLLAVFAFLWMAFDSLLDAAVVLCGLPLGMIGGVITALAMPDGLSMAGLVGFVALAGIISRNGIMLVAHKNQLFAERPDEPRHELVLLAARERLLPILMTAATAFFGLLPLAASMEFAGSELEAPMALIVATGLVTSTLLNLVATPAFYLWRASRGART